MYLYILVIKIKKKNYDFYFISEGKILATAMVAMDEKGSLTNKPWIYHGIFFNKTIESNQNHWTKKEN